MCLAVVDVLYVASSIQFRFQIYSRAVLALQLLP